MNLKNFTAVLFVKDIKVSKEFYSNLLGLEIRLDFGKNVIFSNGLAVWEFRKEHIIPATLGPKNTSDISVNRFEVYFESEDVSSIYEKLKSSNVKFLHEMHEEIWGQRTIRFFDPDNHLIEIGETLKKFVCRFYNQGLTIEEIANKTFVPVEEIKRLIRQEA